MLVAYLLFLIDEQSFYHVQVEWLKLEEEQSSQDKPRQSLHETSNVSKPIQYTIDRPVHSLETEVHHIATHEVDRVRELIIPLCPVFDLEIAGVFQGHLSELQEGVLELNVSYGEHPLGFTTVCTAEEVPVRFRLSCQF